MVLVVALVVTAGCASTPLPQALSLDHPRLGVVEFKVTAPIHHLSSIASAPEGLSPEEEAAHLQVALRHVEDDATGTLVAALNEKGIVHAVVVPDPLFEGRPEKQLSQVQLEALRNDLNLDAVFYGELPWYGRTHLLYPIVGESLDILVESLLLGFATGWNPVVILANVGFELATSTPLWFGGTYLLGWAFRPVTVETWVYSASDGKQVWHESAERAVVHKALKLKPPGERSKKEVPLEASSHAAIEALARVLSEGGHVEWWWPRGEAVSIPREEFQAP